MQCRYSQSLGEGFKGTPQEVWGVSDYIDRNKPVVYVGLYDARDYLALWRHKGKSYVFWCGGDILNLIRGFLLNDGKLKWLSQYFPAFKFLVKHILSKAEHWVENHTERDALFKWGIKKVFVTPSYFGNVDLPITYNHAKPAKVYISCGKNRQEEYGFDVIEQIASQCVNIEFHLYGDDWQTQHKNVIIHNRVPIEQMNKETADMQCGLRLNEFDGFSEILAKAVLRGQYAISKIKYPLIPSYNHNGELVQLLNKLTITYQPNTKVRNFYKQILNNFPWNKYAQIYNK